MSVKIIKFWSMGRRFSDSDAEIIGRELMRIGGSTAEDIKAAAKDPDSPLHRFFSGWDAEKAAELHWNEVAGNMARSIMVTYLDKDGAMQDIRAFHAVWKQERDVTIKRGAEPPTSVRELESVKKQKAILVTKPSSRPPRSRDEVEEERTDRQRTYVPVTEILERPDYQAQLEAEAFRYMLSFYRRYHSYVDQFPSFSLRFRPVMAAIEATLAQTDILGADDGAEASDGDAPHVS